MEANNIEMTEIIAQALGSLKEKIVFTGGSIVELYATIPGLSDIRPTLDVDCIVDMQVRTYLDYSELEEKLRTMGFQNDIRENAPICRKIYKGITVDFIPVFPEILGFSNRWFACGIKNKIEIVLPNQTTINLQTLKKEKYEQSNLFTISTFAHVGRMQKERRRTTGWHLRCNNRQSNR